MYNRGRYQCQFLPFFSSYIFRPVNSIQEEMDFLHKHLLHLFVLLPVVLLFSSQAKSQDEKKNLLQGLNNYRASLNLSTLTEISNADCLADEVANQFKNQPCSNTTGADTVPGTEPQFPNYPNLLAKCHLNITDTRDGVIMPVCIPNLVPSLVLSNYTESQYSQNLNDSTYIGAGIASEGDWMVVVLSTDTTGGSFSTDNAAGLVYIVGLTQNLMPLLLGFFLVLMS